jgi:hypothetical protein
VTAARETFGVTGSGYAVAVLDSGVDSDHPDLIDDILPGGWTFLDQGATSHPGGEDDLFHGTAVAGVITSDGIVAPLGIAPEAKILSIKCFNSEGMGRASDALAGFDYTLSLKVGGDDLYRGLIAINCSFSFGDTSSCPCDDGNADTELFENAARTAEETGIITFAAAGNRGDCGSIGIPACVSAAVAVGAIYHEDVGGQAFGPGGSFGEGCMDSITRADEISCFTNLNDCVELLAPFFVDSTALGGGVELFSGTSCATPHAAAMAVLVQEAAGGALPPDDVVSVLRNTSVEVEDRCGVFGSFPRIDALAAVTAVTSGLDCDASGVSDLLEIATGRAPDCNRNHVPDSCDLAAGSSSDCDINGIPDECDADCNDNGVPDACDLAAGTASDCNENGIPDECDLVPSAQAFSPGPGVLLGEGAIDAVLADLDGDELPDLAGVLHGSAAVRVFRNDGSGAQAFLAEHDAGGDGPIRILAADIDLDRSPDLVVLHAGSFFSPGESLAVLRGRGDGTFAEAVVFSTGSFPFEVLAADLDGDALPDLVTANARSQDLTVLRNQSVAGGAISFAPPSSYAPSAAPRALVVIDVDRDGRLDLVSGGMAGLDVLLGAGDGSFQPPQHLLLDVAPRLLVAGDLDGDGFQDIAALDAFDSGSDGVKLLFSQDGGFSLPRTLELEQFATVAQPSHLVLADLSGDGHADILASLPGLRAVSFLRSLGGGRFAPPRLVNPTRGVSRLTTGDIDGDGDLDLGAIDSFGAFVTIRNDQRPPRSTDRDRDGVPDECAPPPLRFRRGNANADAAEDISDAITVLGFLFLGRPERLACDKAADVNDDGSIDLSDAVALLNHLFLGAPAPPAPFGECGTDGTGDALTCADSGSCAGA